MKTSSKICQNCQNNFIDTCSTQTARFCSRKCKGASYRKNRSNSGSEYFRLYREQNKARHKILTANWQKLNRDKCNAYLAKYRAAKLSQTPRWLNDKHLHSIELYYSVAKWIGEILDIEVEVDHIIPLQGDNVRGLHVPWNLQLLTAKENGIKGNKTPQL